MIQNNEDQTCSIFPLLCLDPQPLLRAGKSVPEPVIDTSGKKLRADANYHIIPAVPFTICGFVRCFSSGGVALGSTDESCLLDVVVKNVNDMHRQYTRTIYLT